MRLVLKCCKAKLYEEEKCRCKQISTIRKFLKGTYTKFHSFPTVRYEKINIQYDHIHLFQKQSRNKNDKSNKFRELVIGAILNNKIPKEYYKSCLWKRMYNELHKYVRTMSERHVSYIDTVKCIHKGGRKFNYDFTIIVNDTFQYNVEFKFNATKIDDAPQFVSPMKPSQYLSDSYEQYYYNHYLVEFAKKNNLELADMETYMKSIHTNKPQCMIEFQRQYYRGCKSSSQFSGLSNDIKFYNECKKISKDSIVNFIDKTELNKEKLSSYLIDSQKDKHYMLFKTNTIVHDNINYLNYEIDSVKACPKKNSYHATTKTGQKMKILLRWKNGNGIAFPAFQIS